MRRAKPDKRAWAVLSKDRSRGVVRPAAEGEDTAPGGDDAAGGACLLTGPIRSVGGYEMKDRRGGGERGPWPASIPRPVRRIKHKPGDQPGFLNPLSLAGAIQPAALRGGPCRVASWTRHHRAKGSEPPCGKVRPCASDRDPKGRDYAAALTIAPLHGQARNETSGQDQAQRKGRGIGSGRRPALAGRSLERGPGQRTGCAHKCYTGPSKFVDFQKQRERAQ